MSGPYAPPSDVGPIRCPALRIAVIENHEIKEIHRCELPTKHHGSHEAKGIRWTFDRYSYHGLSEDSPEFLMTVDAVVKGDT